MRTTNGLEQRLQAVLDGVERRTAARRQAVETRIQEIGPRRARFEREAESWMGGLILPRIEALARLFPHAQHEERTPGALTASLKFISTRAHPFGASLTVSISAQDSYRRAMVTMEPQLIPMLAASPPATSRVWEMGAEDLRPLEGFLDDGIVVFAEAYASACEPSSPYQRAALVVDPVCGMTIHPVEAFRSLEQDGHRYHFCTAYCADRFQESPERYVVSSLGAMNEAADHRVRQGATS